MPNNLERHPISKKAMKCVDLNEYAWPRLARELRYRLQVDAANFASTRCGLYVVGVKGDMNSRLLKGEPHFLANLIGLLSVPVDARNS